MGLRGRLHLGPALRRLRLPVRSTLVSVIFHAAFGAAVLWGNAVWGGSEPKPVIVNLVPAIAAVGVPQGRQQPEQRSEEHTSELQSQSNLVCRLLLEKKKTRQPSTRQP